MRKAIDRALEAARLFARDPAGDELWTDHDHQDALERLAAAMTRRQHALVISEPGLGKTTVLRALRARLAPNHYRVTYIAHTTLGRRDFYRQLCTVLGVQASATAASLFHAVQKDLAQMTAEHRVHNVLVLDEAHLLQDAVLGHLHVLCNFDWDSKPLLSLVLIGLPELQERLRMSAYRSLLTRIACKVELTPPNAEQTATYVRKRLAAAGVDDELFTPDGMAMLHELSGGVLRSVDVLAEASLRSAAEVGQSLVDRTIVRRALHNTPLA